MPHIAIAPCASPLALRSEWVESLQDATAWITVAGMHERDGFFTVNHSFVEGCRVDYISRQASAVSLCSAVTYDATGEGIITGTCREVMCVKGFADLSPSTRRNYWKTRVQSLKRKWHPRCSRCLTSYAGFCPDCNRSFDVLALNTPREVYNIIVDICGYLAVEQ